MFFMVIPIYVYSFDYKKQIIRFKNKYKNMDNIDNKNTELNLYNPTWDDGEIPWDFSTKEEKVMNYINYNIVQNKELHNKETQYKMRLFTQLEEIHYKTLVTLLIQNLYKELFTFENIINNIQNINIYEN